MTVSIVRTLKSGIEKRKRHCPVCKSEIWTYEIDEKTLKNAIKGFSPEEVNEGSTLCWTCKRATGFCSWSHDFKPVQGWVAMPTVIFTRYGNTPEIESFDVQECPLYIKDER
jgi:hypothetical protein